MTLLDVAKIIKAFLGWAKQILNALGITAFDEAFSNAMAEL